MLSDLLGLMGFSVLSDLDKQDACPLSEDPWACTVQRSVWAEQPGWATQHPAIVFAVLTWHMWPGRRHAASQKHEEASRSKCQACGELTALYESVTQVSLKS